MVNEQMLYARLCIADLPMIALVEPLFSVPFQRDYNFIDRKDIFSQIKEQLQMHHRVSLYGMGGIEYRFFPLNKLLQTLTEGVRKSQIAIEYAYRFRQSHPQCHVF